MAKKYPTTKAEVKVYINGKDQAKKDLEDLRKVAKTYADTMEDANNKMLESANRLAEARKRAFEAGVTHGKSSDQYREASKDMVDAQQDNYEAQKAYNIAEKEWKKYQRLIKETEKMEVDLEEALQRLSDQNISRLRMIERQLKAVRDHLKGEDDPDQEFLSYLNDAIQQVTDTIKQKKGEIVEFSDIMDDLTNIDDTSLAKAEQRLKSLLAATDKDDIDRIKQLSSELKKVQDEGKRRVKVEAVAVQQQVADGTYKGTIEETQRAIKLQEEYKKSLKTTDSKSIKEVEKTIEGLNKKLDAYQKKQTASVLKNLDDSSYAQIQAAIEHAKKLQQAAKPGSSAWNNYGKQIANATLYLEKWNDQQKRTKMVEMSKMDLGKMSDDDLKTALRYWDGMVNGIGRTNVAMKQYKEIYDRLQAENTKRGEKLISKVVDQNDLGGNINQMQQRLQILEDFRKTIDSTKPDAYLRVDAAIDKLKQGIKETQANFMSFDDALKKAQQVADGTFDGTLEDIEKIQKALKEGMTSELNIVDDADLQKMKEAQRLMEETAKKQQELARIRLEEQAKLTQEQVEKGTYKGTIEETEKAIAIQKQYQKTLDTTDAAGFKKVEDTIEALQQKLKQAQSELLSYKDAMSEADKISKGTWKGTIEELDKIKKSLEYYKKNKLKIGADDKDLKKVNEALRDIDKTAKGTAMSALKIQNVIDHLDTASVEELEIAAKNLQEQLHGASRNIEGYTTKAADLRKINAELKKAKKEWEGQENVIAKTAKRLAAYVAVYGGFNAIVDKMKEVVGLNLQLSDSLADVQKTTGLTGIELQELGRDLGAIDTRTATTELYQLAAAAGQVGLKTQEDVLGFAKAANIISVALNELGAEGSATITKIATLTGDVARSGTEDALLKVGSAINELTANSAATAGPIADFISRVGGIASASGIAIHEMAALGAATDASAQSIEIAGTSMNKFITALLSNTENIAYAANLSVAELNTLIEQGDTMQAVIRVLEAMKNMSREGQSAVLKELGSEGARMNQYVAALVANLDMLKSQLALSREAFYENTSVINEYNVKQESAIGILQRMKNSFLDTFVNSRMVEVLKDILQAIANIPRDLAKFPVLLATIKTAIMAIILLKLPLLLDKLLMQLSGLYTLLRGPILAGIASFNNAWNNSANAVVSAGKSVNGFTGFLRVLWGVIKANPIGLIVTAMSAFVIALQSANAEAKKLAKITGDLSEKQSRQLDELQALRTAMNDSNASYADRAGAMKEINQMYSKYLGFEIRELEVYEKKAAALELIVAKLKEQQALELKQGTQSFYNEEFSKDTQTELEVISGILEKIPEITSKRVPEAIRVMNAAIESGAESTEELFKALDKYYGSDLADRFSTLGELFKARTGTETDKNIFDFFVDAYDKEQFEDYIDEYKKRRQGLLIAEENYNYQSEKAVKEAFEKRIALAKAQENRIAELQKEGNKATESEQVEHLRNMLREQEEYLITLETLRKGYKEQDDSFVRSNIHEDGTVEKFNLEQEYGILAYVESTKLDNIARWRNKAAEDAINKQKELNAALARLDEERLKENNEKAIATEEETVNKLKKEHYDLNQQKTVYDRQWQEQYSRLLQFTVSDERKANDEKIKAAKEAIDDLNFNIDKDPYGKALNLKDWKEFDKIIEGIDKASPKSLINAFKKLNEDYQKFSDNLPALNQMFQFKVPMHSLDEARDQIFHWANQLRDELQRRGLTTTGATIFKGLVGEVDNQLDIIKVKFAKQQKEIKDAYLSGSISSEEMNRRIVENDREMMNERLELRKMLLGEDHAFHAELYPEMDKEYLIKLKRRLTTANTEVITTLRQGLEDDSNAVAEETIKMRERFEKELTAGDPFGTLRTKFRSSLDELLLMSSDFERQMAKDLQRTFENLDPNTGNEIMGLDKESQEERLDFLIELSEKSYTVDRDGLRKMFESHGEYYNWVTHLDDQQMDVMLSKLQWFYDESLVKHRAYADRLIKAQESSYEQQGLKLDDVAKLQWERQNLINQRAALQSQNTLVTNKPVDPAQRAKNESDILAHTQAINRLDEQILEAQKKAAEKNKSFRNKQEREAKDEMEASISALKAYYKEQEAVIRQNALDKKWTPEELERKLTENTIKAEKDAIELRKKLLGDPSTFDPFANDSYKGAITGTVFFGKTRNLEKQAEEIKLWGKGFRDGMRNEIAESNVEIAKEMQKVSDVIKNALLEGDMFGKFENEFATMLDELGILTSDFEKEIDTWREESNKNIGTSFNFGFSEEERNKRIAELTRFADKAYQVNEEGLRKLMTQNTMFSNWASQLNDSQMTVLLQKLRGYYDDRLELTKKYQDQMKKTFDAYYQQSGKQAEYEQNKNNIELRNQQQSDLEGFGITKGVDYGAKRQSISDSFDVENQKYLDQIANYKEQSEALTKDMVKVFQEKGLGSPEYQEMYRQKEAMDQLVLDTELERNKLLAQSQRDLTQVYMDEWTKRAERWGQWGEMFGEYLGEQVMLEKQANDARARGDLETAKKIEQQQKQNKQALIQNLLSKIVDEAALWAKEYALKMMFNSLMLTEEKKRAVEEATLQGKSSMLSILLNALTGQSKEHAKGLPGLVTGAIVFAATMALQAFAKSAIANMFPEAATGSTGSRPLSTGMLTYKDGNYPVLGNDGKVYDAKYEGAGMKTGIYGGGAHFGIFSEKQPEMIVDGKTTQKLILNYPYIYDAITTIAKNGRLVNAMPTFATGDYPAGMKPMTPIATVEAPAGNNEQMERTNAVLEQATSVIRELSKVLTSGQISASVDPYANRKATQRAEKFMKRRGID